MNRWRSCPAEEGGARNPSSAKRVIRTKREGNILGDNNGVIHSRHKLALSHQPPRAHPSSTQRLEMGSGLVPPSPRTSRSLWRLPGASSPSRRWARARQRLFGLPGDTNPPGRWAAEDEPLARLSQPSKSLFSRYWVGFFFKHLKKGEGVWATGWAPAGV